LKRAKQILISSRSALSLCYLLLFCIPQTKGQVNYVKNASLEQYDTCPFEVDQIRFAKYWTCIDTNLVWYNLTPSDGQPEYINTCDNTHNNAATAPDNARFFHYPRTGNGMAQVMMYFYQGGLGYNRDYLQGRLYKPLIGGKTYCVTFYVTQEQQSNYSIKQVQAYLDNGMIDTATFPGVPQTQYTPQIQYNNFVSDTLNWVKIEGSFTANGNERFITIGDFFNNANTDTIAFNTNSMFYGLAIYLVDDISVIESDTKAYAGPDVGKGSADSVLLGRDEIIPGIKWWRDGVLIDTLNAGLWCKDSVPGVHTYILSQTLCGLTTWDTVKVTVWPLNVENVGNLGNVKVFPNPAKDEITISSSNVKEGLLRIFDISGKQLLEQQFSQNNTSIHLDLSAGVYVLKLTDASGACNVQRLIIYK